MSWLPLVVLYWSPPPTGQHGFKLYTKPRGNAYYGASFGGRLAADLLLVALASGCSGSVEPTCDPRWDQCVAAGLTVECVSNGAEALCTCQGTLDGRLEALVCRP